MNEQVASLMVAEISEFLDAPVRFLALQDEDRELLRLVQEVAAAAQQSSCFVALPDDARRVLVGTLPWRWQPQTSEVEVAAELRPVIDDPARVEFFEKFRDLPVGSLAVIVTGLNLLIRRERSSVMALIGEIGGKVLAVKPVPRRLVVPASSMGSYLVTFLRDQAGD